ncbi:hypothetical protein QOZ80_3AG0217730 [Eleusine coracana subsp. coracana]|nr:hypothetical protein QOZ80_3AG0217730 [Eleusine coracana subsp. coracana]
MEPSFVPLASLTPPPPATRVSHGSVLGRAEQQRGSVQLSPRRRRKPGLGGDHVLDQEGLRLGAGDDEPLAEFGYYYYPGIRATGVVHPTTDDNLVVLTVDFCYHTYYLVYDAGASSLSMVPHLPPDNLNSPHPSRCAAAAALIMGGPDGGGGGRPGVLPHRSVADEAAALRHGRTGRRRPARFLLFRHHFLVQRPRLLGPSRAGHHALRPARRRRRQLLHVDIHFIELPPGYELHDSDEMIQHVGMFRTMGRVGDSIKFASIARSTGVDIGASTVAVWTLQWESRSWTRDAVFSVRSLWETEGFKRAGLPEMEPKCPVLMKDGALCLLQPNRRMRIEDSLDDYICSIDVSSKTVLWSGRLCHHNTSQPIILPSHFFKDLRPPLN